MLNTFQITYVGITANKYQSLLKIYLSDVLLGIIYFLAFFLAKKKIWKQIKI